MSRQLRQAGVVFVGIFAAAQLVRPNRANPAVDASRTIQAQMGTTSALVTIVDRACAECHSNATVWPWYTQIAPVSWLMARGVEEARTAVNFSEWAGYSPDQQRTLLAASCDDAVAGKMPGMYARLHRDARLSARDVETVCSAAHRAETSAANQRIGR